MNNIAINMKIWIQHIWGLSFIIQTPMQLQQKQQPRIIKYAKNNPPPDQQKTADLAICLQSPAKSSAF